MNWFLQIAFCGILLVLSRPESALAQSAGDDRDAQPWVEYRNGEVSMAFYQTPVELAVYAIRARTGFQIVLPPNKEGKLLNLRLNRTSLEPAVKTVISSAGFRSFAFIYDDQGRPNRAVVLESIAENRAPTDAAESQGADPAAQPLSGEERDKLRQDIGRWGELSQEDRGRIEDRLKNLPPTAEREQLVKEYGRQRLGLKN